MSIQLYVSTRDLDLKPGESPSDFQLHLQPGLRLGSLNWTCSLLNLATWYSIHNFNANLHNNIFRVWRLIDNTPTYSPVLTNVISNGIFTVDEFISYFNTAVENHFDDPYKQCARFSVFKPASKITLTLADDAGVEMTVASAKQFGLIAWDDPRPDTDWLTYSGNGDYTNQYAAQWTNGIDSISLDADLVSNSISNGGGSGIIATFTPRGPAYSSIYHEPINLSRLQVNQSNIDTIRFRLIDNRNRIVDLNGEHLQFTLLFERLK